MTAVSAVLAPATSEATARLLRNTYNLLALTLLPTAAGAWLGQYLPASPFAGSPFIGFLAVLAISFGFMWAIQRNRNNGLGVALLLGFTFFMGLLLARTLAYTMSYANGSTLVTVAGLGTAAVFFGLAAIATTTRRDFSGMGKFLFIGLMLALLAMVANIFLQLPALQLAISTIMVGLSSAYILYDVNRIVRGGETSYVSATLALYLDIFQLFVHLLHLVTALLGERD